MQQRRISAELIVLAIKFRKQLTNAFAACTTTTLDKTMAFKEEIMASIDSFQQMTGDNSDKTYYTSLQLFFKSLFQLIDALYLQVNGKPGFSELLAAAKLNAGLFDASVNDIDGSRPSVMGMLSISSKIKNVSAIQDVITLVKDASVIGFATYITSETDRWGRNPKQKSDNQEDLPEEKEKHLIISVRFYFDGEPWANPQVIKPNLRYNLSGELKLNEWPEGYDKLVLSPVTTSDDSHYVLSLPEIQYTSNGTIPIQGSIVVKYAQRSFEKPMAIKILARFMASEKITLYPLIIGYDQLILKSLDSGSFPFPTGYSKLNEKAFEIITAVKQQLPALTDEELEHFHILLSGILNYQGYCAEFSEYKSVTTLSEDDFRDNMIRYLSASPELTSKITKEGQIAGGRVEIRFKEIIAELKVERTLSDREKSMAKYEKQPVAYASATSAQLSILCILDLTPKTRPPAMAVKNVFHRKVKVHGFSSDTDATHVVVIFIDGNIPNPSSYK